MKTRAITVLSMVGVLTAGSAAAMVNTRVLSKDSTPKQSQSILTVTGVPQTTILGESASADPMVSEDVADQSAPDSVAPAQVRSLTASTATPISVVSKPATSNATSARRLSAFQIGDAGVIRIDSGESDFRIADVVPGSGWTVVSYTPGTTAGEAQVVLSSGSVEVTFIAELVGGNIVTRVESRSMSSGGGGGGGGSSSSSSGSGESDDDESEYEDEDEYDDEDEYEDDEDGEDHEDEDDDHEEDEDDD